MIGGSCSGRGYVCFLAYNYCKKSEGGSATLACYKVISRLHAPDVAPGALLLVADLFVAAAALYVSCAMSL